MSCFKLIYPEFLKISITLLPDYNLNPDLIYHSPIELTIIFYSNPYSITHFVLNPAPIDISIPLISLFIRFNDHNQPKLH